MDNILVSLSITFYMVLNNPVQIHYLFFTTTLIDIKYESTFKNSLHLLIILKIWVNCTNCLTLGLLFGK